MFNVSNHVSLENMLRLKKRLLVGQTVARDRKFSGEEIISKTLCNKDSFMKTFSVVQRNLYIHVLGNLN
jgi:hypothetical protein